MIDNENVDGALARLMELVLDAVERADRDSRVPAAMPVLQRNELEASPLADLHAIASELGLEGFRGSGRTT